MEDIEPKVTKVVHSIIYQIVKIGVACSSYMEIVNKDIECITSETEIKGQKHYLKELLDKQKNLNDFISIIDREAAQNFTPNEYLDIRKFFNKLYIEESAPNREIGFGELNEYTTAFLVSNINIRIENFTTLVQTHHKVSEGKKVRIVWIPIVDQTVGWTDADEKSFNELANLMPWCCCHPSMLTKAFSTHVVESWQYKNEPSLVVLNKKAEVITKNALPAVETWGDKAYPFSSSEMITTFSNNWTIKGMVEDWEIDLIDWENDIVCIYGGHNLEMTRSFSQYVQGMKNNNNSIQIKTIYVGTNAEKEKLQYIASSLEQMNVKCLSMSLMSPFWKRLVIVLNNAFDKVAVMKQLPALLSYNKEELWTTIMYKGSTELIKPTGKHLLQCLDRFNETNMAIGTTDELWNCLLQVTKSENLTRSAISASACARVRDLFGIEHQDVSDVLSKIFIKETGIFDGQTNLEHFKGKSVGFLVTDAKIGDYTSLLEKYKQIYPEPDIKIIWIPIAENGVEEKSFQEKALAMRWSYCHLSMLTKDFSTYIRQGCYSEARSTLMVLNKHGKFVSTLQWDSFTYTREYHVKKEPQSKWFQYNSAKELDIYHGQLNSNLKISTVYEYDGIRDVPVDVLEIIVPFNWAVCKVYNVKLTPKTLYEIIFLVMLTEEAQGLDSPLQYSHCVTNDNKYKQGSEVIDDKPRGVWFEIKLVEFSLRPGKTDGVVGFYLFSTEYKHRGIMIKGAGIREKKR